MHLLPDAVNLRELLIDILRLRPRSPSADENGPAESPRGAFFYAQPMIYAHARGLSLTSPRACYRRAGWSRRSPAYDPPSGNLGRNWPGFSLRTHVCG